MKGVSCSIMKKKNQPGLLAKTRATMSRVVGALQGKKRLIRVI